MPQIVISKEQRSKADSLARSTLRLLEKARWRCSPIARFPHKHLDMDLAARTIESIIPLGSSEFQWSRVPRGAALATPMRRRFDVIRCPASRMP